jgi:hypothetical protein
VYVLGLGSTKMEVGRRLASMQMMVGVMRVVAGLVELQMALFGWFVNGSVINGFELM